MSLSKASTSSGGDWSFSPTSLSFPSSSPSSAIPARAAPPARPPPPLPPPGSGRPRPAPPRRARSTACLLGFQRGGRSNAAHHPPAHARARQRPTPTTANQGDGKRGEEMDFSIAISASLSLPLPHTHRSPFPLPPPVRDAISVRCGAAQPGGGWWRCLESGGAFYGRDPGRGWGWASAAKKRTGADASGGEEG